jgi:hypothetical protein
MQMDLYRKLTTVKRKCIFDYNLLKIKRIFTTSFNRFTAIVPCRITNILSGVRVTIDGVWIDNWIYLPLTDRIYK